MYAKVIGVDDRGKVKLRIKEKKLYEKNRLYCFVRERNPSFNRRRKGIAISSGETWCIIKVGGVGTFSGVNADSYDENGNLIPQIYKEKTRSGRQRVN